MTDTVYVVTNPAMPGLVKIGFTSDDDVTNRIAQLYSTGVPVPFQVEFACKVRDGQEVENALHTAFAPNRINPRREFFSIDPGQVIPILKLLQTEDVTPQVLQTPDDIDADSKAAGEQLRKRRPNINFEEMGIPEGSTLNFTQGDARVTVVGPKKVRLGDGEPTSLTAATRQVADTDYDLPPALYWTFNGRLLREIYEETYDPIE